MNIKFLLLIAAAAAAVFLFIFVKSGCSLDSRAVVKEWIDKGALIVDVRTPEEFTAGHYEGSVNIPLGELESKIDLFGDKENHIVVYCRTGNRSGKAEDILKKNGYKNVINGGGLKDMKVTQ